MCAPRVTRHTSIRYSSSCTQASTWVPRYSSLLQWSVPLGQLGHVAMVRCVLCTKCTLHSNHRFTRVMFQHTKTTSPLEWPFSHYIHSHRLAAEMWTTMKNNLLGKNFLSCSFYLYRFRKYVPYGFPIINFCNPGVHYETPCITKILVVPGGLHPFVCLFVFGATPPQWARVSSFTRFLDHKQQRTTVGWAPLDEWSALSNNTQLSQQT